MKPPHSFISNDSKQGSKIENSKECKIISRSTNSVIEFSNNCIIQNSPGSIIKFSNNCKMINCNNCIIEFSTGYILTNRSNVNIVNGKERIENRRRVIVNEDTGIIRTQHFTGNRESSRPMAETTSVRRKIGTSSDCNDDLKKMCSICSDTINNGEVKTILDCIHHYHKDCIEKWSTNSNKCPECRTEF